MTFPSSRHSSNFCYLFRNFYLAYIQMSICERARARIISRNTYLYHNIVCKSKAYSIHLQPEDLHSVSHSSSRDFALLFNDPSSPQRNNNNNIYILYRHSWTIVCLLPVKGVHSSTRYKIDDYYLRRYHIYASYGRSVQCEVKRHVRRPKFRKTIRIGRLCAQYISSFALYTQPQGSNGLKVDILNKNNN